MRNEILAKYYEGISHQLRGEVDFINEVFRHQGLKGEGNEATIRNLLQKFIPRKYGVGSGIVIDRNGTPSKQCDIVIYDNYNYPEILALTAVHLYPVDLVYTTIEVKTTLDAEKARQAIENIKSVRSLNFIKESFRTYPSDPDSKPNPETVLWETTVTTPPLGIVFGYRSETSNYGTFASWFRKQEGEDTTFWPLYVFCLDQGVLCLPGTGQRSCLALPLLSGDDLPTPEPDQIQQINGKNWAAYAGRLFPLSKVKTHEVFIDQSKTLLYFVVILSELLGKKLLSPHISFHNSYFTDDLATVCTVPENGGEINFVRLNS